MKCTGSSDERQVENTIKSLEKEVHPVNNSLVNRYFSWD